MAYRLEPAPSMERDVRRVAYERIDEALTGLREIEDGTTADLAKEIHEVRKRCKELRGLARLVRPSIGAEYGRFNELVREAASELSSIRDAQAVLATIDELLVSSGKEAEDRLLAIRGGQQESARAATRSLQPGDRRIRRARRLLTRARKRIRHWRLDDGFEPIADGLAVTYRRGRQAMKLARREPSDEHVHEWRKAVKNLWYQMRLLELAAPSMLTPLVARLDDLAESLGDDHDLAVLVEHMEAAPRSYGGKRSVQRAVELARRQQDELRRRAFRLGATIYAEPAPSLVGRVATYWEQTIKYGPEMRTGGIADIADIADTDDRTSSGPCSNVVERERKFLVTTMPDLDSSGIEMRQGYVAIDGSVSVRVRDAGGSNRTLTVKGGRGAIRTELEWPISAEQFEAAWAVTGDRRVDKTRYRCDIDGHTAEIDVFSGQLRGLVIVEVEFDSDEALEMFRPPSWLGIEVTDDDRYTNASLAVNGLPSRS